MERVGNDILDGLAQVIRTFRLANLNPPTVLLLESHEQGRRFLDEIRQTPGWPVQIVTMDFGRVVEMADGSVWMECNVMNIAIRWPANKIAMPDGAWSYI